jgi:hypothetical protein
MIIRPLFVTVLAYNGLSYQIALGPLCMNYTLWEDAVAMGVLCALRLPLDSFSRLDELGTSPIVGKNREAENDESLIAENQRPTDS